jgi:hypothetical protein
MSSVVAPYSLSLVEKKFQIFKIFGREFPANFVATAEGKKNSVKPLKSFYPTSIKLFTDVFQSAKQ